MTPKHLVAIAATLVLGHASGAFAQDAPTAFASRTGTPAQIAPADPLDAIAHVAALYTGQSIATPSIAIAKETTVADANYESYMQLYAMYLASHAESGQVQERPGQAGWMTAMQGISAGLSVTDQAIGVYEHAVEAKALANAYRSN
jgi:hypothetical protein